MKQLQKLSTSLFLSTVALVQLTGAAHAGGGYGSVLATGDFNGDSYPDLAVSDTNANDPNGYGPGSGVVNIKYGTPYGGLSTYQQHWSANSPGVPIQSTSYLGFGKSLAVGDFNDDGYHDLAIGVPTARVSGIYNAGSVVVLYGSYVGLRSSGAQLLHQDTPGIAGKCEPSDLFGSSLAGGDIDNDGADDLVIGAPGEDILDVNSAGMVHILWGSTSGISTSGDLVRHQNTTGVSGECEEQDQFGSALSMGDFNDDGFCDIAVGVPGEDLFGFRSNAGIVQLFRGRSNGVTPSRTLSQFYTYVPTYGADWLAEQFDSFGSTLATGDIDGNGTDDLVVASPLEMIGSNDIAAGAVDVILFKRGSSIRVLRQNQFHQDTPGIGGGSEIADYFGTSLAMGDLNGDGHADLAVGVPLENLGSLSNAGMVHVLYGTNNGLSASGSITLHQNTSGVPCVSEKGDRFGSALAISDFDGDGYADLTVGVAGEETPSGTGILQVFEGTPAGIDLGAKTVHTPY